MAERLDFGSGDGGGLTTDMSTDEEMVETAAKRRRLESDHDSARQRDQPESMDTDSPAVNKSLSELSSSQLDTHDLEIIDELGGEQDEDATYAENRLDQSGDEGSEVSEYDLDDEEIDALLEEGIEAERKGTDGQPEGDAPNAAMRRNKIVLREKGQNPFEILPEGWVTVTHNSGMPVYLHRKSRVCTISKPYFLGSGSARKHEIPLSAVPCLHYRRELQKEQGIHNGGQEAKVNGVSSLSNNTDTSGDLNKESCDDTAQPLPNDVTPAPAPPLPSDVLQAPPLPSDDLPVPPPLPVDPPPSPPPDSTAPPLPDQPPESSAVSNGVDACSQASGVSCTGTTNMDSTANQGSAGETTTSAVPVKIESAEERNKVTSLGPMEFRAYCRRLFQFKVITVVKYKTWKDRRKHHSMLKKQNRPGLPGNTRLITCPIPSEKGDEKKKEFVLNPSGKSYVCILHEYVQHAMRVQPRYIFKELENAQTPYSATVVIDDVEYGTGYASSKKAAKMDAAKSTLSILIPEMVKVTQDENNKDTEDLSFFDEIKIEDPRIYELCTKAGQPSPYQILQECLKRNYGMGDTQCKMEMKQLKHQKNEFYMSVGKHEAKVSCKNKREGKQYAAQAILQLLHPHVQSWGSLLRLYGRRSCNVIKEKKQEEQEITHLQLNARANRPNTAVLEKLKEEMTKLREQKEAIPSKGTIRVSTQELPANVTSINL